MDVGILAAHPLPEVLEPSHDLSLDINEVEVTARIQQVQIRVHCHILYHCSTVEPRPHQLLHSQLVLHQVYLHFVLAFLQQTPIQDGSPSQPTLQDFVEIPKEGHFELLEVLVFGQVLGKLLNISADAIEEPHPD
jgi:hypothetical protein